MKKLLLVGVLLIGTVSLFFGQDWSMDPTYGDVELEEGFLPDPFVLEVLAGGSIDLDDSSDRDIRRLDAYGYVAEAPDVDFYYETSGDFPLTIAVDGFGEDMVLLVNDPSGDWHYNDDEDGVDPAITFRNPESGLYSIWIGTFYDDDYLDAELIRLL